MRFRIIAAISVLILAFAVMPAFAHPGDATFDDVPDTYRAGDSPPGQTHNAVEWFEDQGISQGGWGNTYRPAQKVSRGTQTRWLYNYHTKVVEPLVASAGGGGGTDTDTACGNGVDPIKVVVDGDGTIISVGDFDITTDDPEPSTTPPTREELRLQAANNTSFAACPEDVLG